MKGPTDYIEVKDRLVLFFEKYPEGSVQGSYELVEVNGEPTYIYEARAYRHPQDERPGIGHASESVPGRTPFLKFAELENAGTSAIGRALVCLGIAAHKGVASAQDVRNNQAKNASPAPAGPPASDRGNRRKNSGENGSAGVPLSTEQALTLQLEVDTRSISDEQLITLMCEVMEVDDPALKGAAAAKWADKALGRFPAAKFGELLERIKRFPAVEAVEV